MVSSLAVISGVAPAQGSLGSSRSLAKRGLAHACDFPCLGFEEIGLISQ